MLEILAPRSFKSYVLCSLVMLSCRVDDISKTTNFPYQNDLHFSATKFSRKVFVFSLLIGKAQASVPRFQHHLPKIGTVELVFLDGSAEVLHHD